MIVYVIIAVVILIAAIFYYRKKRKKKMAQGLQIFNASGKLIFDLANRTTYVLGTGQTGTQNGSISNSEIVAGRTWVFVTSAPGDAIIVMFSVSNGKISWTFPDDVPYQEVYKRNLTFMYGVF